MIAALARCHERDIELAGEAIRGAARGRLHVFISTSDLHLEHKLRMTREDALELARRSIRQARQLHRRRGVLRRGRQPHRPRLPLPGGGDGHRRRGHAPSTCPTPSATPCPRSTPRCSVTVRGRVPGRDRVVWSAHCHDDLGLAVANSLAAIEAGVGQVECTDQRHRRAGGQRGAGGDRHGEPGAAPAGPVPDRASTRQEIYRTSQLLSYLTGSFPQPNKAIVGRNAFAHEAGIHQHGVLQHGLTYEIIRPESVGIPRSTLVLGKHSGRHALERRYPRAGLRAGRGEAGRAVPGVHRARRPQARDPRRGPAGAAARELPRRAGGVPADPSAGGLRQRDCRGGRADDRALGRRAGGPRHGRRARSRRRSRRSARSSSGRWR